MAAARDVFTLTWKGIEISAEVGDIASVTAEVIAVPVDKEFSFQYGVSCRLARMGGRPFMASVKSVKAGLKPRGTRPGEVIVFPTGNGGNLQASNIIAVVNPDKQHIRMSYRNVMQKAETNAVTSVAMTGFGTGTMNVDARYSAGRAMASLEELVSGSGFENLKKIVFMDVSYDVIDAFIAEFKIFAKKHSDAILVRNGAAYSDEDSALENLEASSIDKYIKFVDLSGSTASSSDQNDEICVVCLDSLSVPQDGNPVVQLKKCKHLFHRICLEQCFKSVQAQCPTCKKWYGVPRGNQPLGATMTVQVIQGHISGFPDAQGYFQIYYNIPGGVQTSEHLRPGTEFTGTRRIAYLPNTPEGSLVLRMFRLAFDNRLMFTVGDSVTTGARNTVVWNCIHNKTSLHGGPNNFGYPDDSYLDRVKEELAAVGITEEILNGITTN